MKKICATLMAVALLTATAAQADSTNSAALAPGNAAGLKKAQDSSDNTLWFIVGAGAIAAGIAVVASGNSNHTTGGGSTVTTTSTQ